MCRLKGGLRLAVYHCSIKIIGRGGTKPRSAVASAAYRSGTKMTNEYDGVTHDYTRKQGVVYSEIMLPAHAPEKFSERSVLWNSVEKIEKSGNAQLAREVEVSLPRELDRESQVQLVKDYVNRFPVEHCFETPNLHVLNDAFRDRGQLVCFMAEYWLPDLDKVCLLDCPYEQYWFDKTKGWSTSWKYDSNGRVSSMTFKCTASVDYAKAAPGQGNYYRYRLDTAKTSAVLVIRADRVTLGLGIRRVNIKPSVAYSASTTALTKI